jgi:hypothetical protein
VPYYNDNAIELGITTSATDLMYPSLPSSTGESEMDWSRGYFRRNLKLRFTLLETLPRCQKSSVIQRTLHSQSKRFHEFMRDLAEEKDEKTGRFGRARDASYFPVLSL